MLCGTPILSSSVLCMVLCLPKQQFLIWNVTLCLILEPVLATLPTTALRDTSWCWQDSGISGDRWKCGTSKTTNSFPSRWPRIPRTSRGAPTGSTLWRPRALRGCASATATRSGTTRAPCCTATPCRPARSCGTCAGSPARTAPSRRRPWNTRRCPASCPAPSPGPPRPTDLPPWGTDLPPAPSL